MDASPRHLLRVVLSCRRLTAEVMLPAPHHPGSAIVAMASSSEPELTAGARALPDRFTRDWRSGWDSHVAARIGEKLAARLHDLGVTAVRVDVAEELARPPHHRRPLSALFLAVGRAGVLVHGAEQLKWP